MKNTAFASNQLAMSKVFVKATFVSGTFDGKSLSLELPLPSSLSQSQQSRQPHPRFGHAMIPTRSLQRVCLFGGSDGRECS